MTQTPVADFTLKIPNRFKPANFFWPRTSRQFYLDTSVLVSLMMMVDMWQGQHRFIVFYVLAISVAYLLFLFRDWRIGSGDWVHHIDEDGIWRQPAIGKGGPNRSQIYLFNLANLHGIQLDQLNGTAILRLNYTQGSSSDAFTLEIPYLSEDKELVETQLVPFLQTKLNSSSVPAAAGAHTSTPPQHGSIEILPSWRLTLKSPRKHWSYICNADTFSQITGLGLFTTNFFWICTSGPHHWSNTALLALIFLLDAYYLMALFLCGGGRWFNYVDDKGIWVCPASTYGVQKVRILMSFKLHTLTRIEDLPGDTTNVLRCHYTNGHTFTPNTFDLPYAAEDRDLAVNVVLPFLTSQIEPAKVQPASQTRRVRRRTA